MHKYVESLLFAGAEAAAEYSSGSVGVVTKNLPAVPVPKDVHRERERERHEETSPHIDTNEAVILCSWW